MAHFLQKMNIRKLKLLFLSAYNEPNTEYLVILFQLYCSVYIKLTGKQNIQLVWGLATKYFMPVLLEICPLTILWVSPEIVPFLMELSCKNYITLNIQTYSGIGTSYEVILHQHFSNVRKRQDLALGALFSSEKNPIKILPT